MVDSDWLIWSLLSHLIGPRFSLDSNLANWHFILQQKVNNQLLPLWKSLTTPDYHIQGANFGSFENSAAPAASQPLIFIFSLFSIVAIECQKMKKVIGRSGADR